MVRIHARVPESLKSEFESLMAESGMSMSEGVRELLRTAVNDRTFSDGGETDALPENDELRRAFLVLDRLAAPKSRQVSVAVAESEVAGKLNRPKRTVRDAIFEPLRHQGLIEPRYKRLVVEEVDGDA
jgi:hypothetical protein